MSRAINPIDKTKSAEPHGSQQYYFLLRAGSEVVAVDVELSWRISDVLKYAYVSQNPEELLKELAYKAIMLRTNSTDSDSILSRDRSELANELQKDIQDGADSNNLGVEVTKVLIVAIHPPERCRRCISVGRFGASAKGDACHTGEHVSRRHNPEGKGGIGQADRRREGL